MIKFADHTTGISDVLGSSVDGGEVRLNLGFYQGTSEDLGIGAASPMWSQAGFASRPADPGSGGAAMALWLQDGDQRRVLATRDNRRVEKVGDLKPGGVAIFSSGTSNSFVTLDGENGTISIYSPYAYSSDVPGKAHLIALNTESGNESISIVHGEGHSILMTTSGSLVLKNKAGDAYIEINDGGIVLNGNVTINGGFVAGDVTTALPVLVGTPPGTPSTVVKISINPPP
jgi:hypothetical protein